MPVELYGGGYQVSDMVWVGDVARALVSALETVATGQVVDVVEVGPTRSATIRELAEIAIGLAVDRGFDPVPIVDLPMRPGEDPKTPVRADAETLRGIGIDPASLRDLSDGLAETVDWFIKTEGEHWTAPNGLRRAG